MRWLLIGYGNPSRQDDGVGHYVINRLRAAIGLSPLDLLAEPGSDGPDDALVAGRPVRALWLQQLDLALAEELAEAERLILVDCHLGGPEQSEWEVEERPFDGPTTHVVTPGVLLQVARRAFGRAPAARVYSVRGESFEFGDQLTPVVRERADALAARLLAEVRGDA